ncbi:hypothetical protein llap_3945 [Limosa lapponica baueri]|uniref:Uncharacterized protein n=1 Tax=Limosa lapponica baueri TaxID=1758121 RepID=A0A2I0UI88_LIMLA|nr:hypothetical protein llap_3945 [Limosa lapponica baueri]
MGPIWELCQQKKEEAEKSLSLIAVTKDVVPTGLVKDGWHYHRELLAEAARWTIIVLYRVCHDVMAALSNYTAYQLGLTSSARVKAQSRLKQTRDKGLA